MIQTVYKNKATWQVTETQLLVPSLIPKTHIVTSTKGTQILLVTAPVKIISRQTLPVEASILLENGSHKLLKIYL